MNKLNTLVRMTLLRYPTLFATRWDVLQNLYLGYGHGYEWAGGELTNIFEEDDEEKARARFFRDIDDDEVEHAKEVDRGVIDCLVDLYEDRKVNFGLRRKRRQFQLDNIDLITREDRTYLTGSRSNPHGLVRTMSRAYSPIFLVPADAEESFSKGAREVFHIVIPMIWESIRISIVLVITGILKIFDIVFIMTEGGPNGLTHVPVTLLYYEAFKYNDYGIGNAIAIVVFLLSILLSFLALKLTRRED